MSVQQGPLLPPVIVRLRGIENMSSQMAMPVEQLVGNRLSRRQKGFSLIEVLVTMLVLAFGLLGVAGLLVGGVSNASSSEAFSKASQLAADINAS